MSVVMIVAPIISAGWPILTTAACSAVGAMGYTLVKSGNQTNKETKTESVEFNMENSEVLKDRLQEQNRLEFRKDNLTVTFFADDRGRCKVKVCGDGKTKKELQQIGTDVMNKVTQQYVYNKVVSELKQQGYSVASEEMNENKSVRVIVRRFS